MKNKKKYIKLFFINFGLLIIYIGFLSILYGSNEVPEFLTIPIILLLVINPTLVTGYEMIMRNKKKNKDLEDDRIRRRKEKENLEKEKKQRIDLRMSLESEILDIYNRIPIFNFYLEKSKSINEESNSNELLLQEAIELVIKEQRASTALIQHRFVIGYDKASNIIDSLEEIGVIGPVHGSKPRKVYFRTYEEFQLFFSNFEESNSSAMLFNIKEQLEYDLNMSDFISSIKPEDLEQFSINTLLIDDLIKKLTEKELLEQSLFLNYETIIFSLLAIDEFRRKGYVITFKYINNLFSLRKLTLIPVINADAIKRNNLFDKITKKEALELVLDIDKMELMNKIDDSSVENTLRNLTEYLFKK